MGDPLLAAVSAALVAGFFGSAHCLGMCGGIAGLFAVKMEVAKLSRRLHMALLYNVGRILGYAVLGFVVAGIGRTLAGVIPVLADPVRFASGVLIVLVGLQLAFNWRPLSILERGGAGIWQRIAPSARSLLPVTSAAKAVALGFLWGFLPCGLVYGALLIAATSGEALNGAYVMTAFGLGTLPAMLLTGMGSAQLQAFMAKTWARRGAGLLVVVMGLITLWMPLTALLGGDPHAHH
ncbi:MAG: sulfite exporter TauE/SafE family protein [Pseudomonadota bacterium]